MDVLAEAVAIDEATFEKGKVRLSFHYVGDGLVAKGGQLKGFSVAEKDGPFVWAEAQIDGDEVIVWSPEIKNPTAVRYGWANNPICTLYNTAGLPASPFRTDARKGVTADAK